MKKLTRAAFFIALGVFATPAQVKVEQKCPAPIYNGREVTKRAKIIVGPNVSTIYKVAPNVRGTIALEAVLCRDGRVTDIRVIEGTSPTANEFTVAALSLMSFTPAELRWHTVSQRMGFEFHFGPDPGVKTSADAAGRLVEQVVVMGNRRLTAKEILSLIKTRPGDRFSEAQIKQDFDAILATGNFDKSQTRAFTEEAARGGVGVYFEVVELPLIADVRFEGLKVDPSLILNAWEKEGVFVKVGAPFDLVAVKQAERIIKQVLDSLGHRYSRVETLIETSLTKLSLVFVIKD